MRSKNGTVGTIMLRFTAVTLLSMILHFSMYTAVEYAPSPKLDQNITFELVEKQIEPKDSNNNFEKPVVKNSIKTEPHSIEKPANFIAEKNQRFEKQTRVEKKGLFNNAKQVSQKTKSPASENQNKDDLPEFARAIQNESINSGNRTQMNDSQVSSSPYELPADISLGSATNLNADAHIYASFYNRVIELFYVRWAQNLDYIFDRLPFDIKRQLSGKNWTTDLEIQLSPDGIYQKGLVLKNSGFKPFDEAGLKAFKDARVFPNPPRAKVEPDGFVRLKYRILVQIR